MYQSFILISSPQMCGQNRFEYQKHFIAISNKVMLESVDVLAINCDKTSDIPEKVFQIFAEYRKKQLTEDNVQTMTMIGVCHAWFQDNELSEVSDEMLKELKSNGIDVKKEDCLYISIPDYVVKLARYSAKQILSRNN